MTQSPMITMMITGMFLVGCAGFETITTPTPTLVPTPTPACHQPGTLNTDKVFFPESQENHLISVYLPPCYAEYTGSAYPVMYWANNYGQYLYDTTDQLIAQGDVLPFIIVDVDIDPNKGFGADAQIIDHVVPYIDAHYRTQADRLHRSITGISNGGAIAIRAAFRAPNIFSRVAVLSGGIADGEQEKFTQWVSAMPPSQRPVVLIDVADQDGVLFLTHYLTALLDALKYPYTFLHGPGGHGDVHIAEDVKWLVPAH